ncbi:Smr/MutS family protein [Corticimicrobacter populi]|uniref:Smr domain-containing protein n=1 Tax=Corticimicrobacter populi TaxID=2175229 RepID=A0A2V1K662_9BURK|nr:Smr/MutS family protein [Corticimicrobacter populi]PWF25169.1 hypothetical protein DD235_03160 [Corticimicrobacter populi]
MSRTKPRNGLAALRGLVPAVSQDASKRTAPARTVSTTTSQSGGRALEATLVPHDTTETDLFRKAIGEVTPVRAVSQRHAYGQQPRRALDPEALERRRQAAVTADATQAAAEAAQQAARAALNPRLASAMASISLEEISSEHHRHGGYLQPGADISILAKLHQGQWGVQAHVDLHGQTLAEAELAVHDFLSNCSRNRLRCVLIVHGKGHGSSGSQPVLREHVRQWLRWHTDVQAFIEPGETYGGAGAALVLLRKGQKAVAE